MGQFCMAYHLGIGMHCREDQGAAIIDITRPVSYVFTAFAQQAIQLSQICSRICSCHSMGPDEPEVHEPSRAHIQGLDTADEEEESPADTRATRLTSHTSQQTNVVSNDEAFGTVCDGRLYGHPLYADCGAALLTLPDYSQSDRRLNLEHFGVGVQPAWQPALRAVQTPQILTSGGYASNPSDFQILMCTLAIRNLQYSLYASRIARQNHQSYDCECLPCADLGRERTSRLREKSRNGRSME